MVQSLSRHLLIERLGQRGEGIAQTPDGPVYVPYALPGDEVRAIVDGERGVLGEIITPSPDRIAPFCPHYGQCGGCAVQALASSAYQVWKRELVVSALAHAGVECTVDELIDAHGAGRRRAAFHARMQTDALGRTRVECGFMRARSHDVINIDHCPILTPAMAAAPRVAAAIAQAMGSLGKPLDLWITALDDGLDVDVQGAGAIPDDLRRRLAALAAKLDLVRLSIHGETLIQTRPPRLAMGQASVEPPPGAFLQATAAGEEKLAELVMALAGKSRHVADLFAGVGTFTLRLAQGARVHAVESSPAAIEALRRAAGRLPRAKTVTAVQRDLFRRPLDAEELTPFDAVVLDPPRAGAQSQSQALAASHVPLVVAVSCNVQTFARDARILLDGGYELQRVTPIDQFRHSPHVELVAAFRKAPVSAPRQRRLLG